MSHADVRSLSNNFQDVRLVSLASWKQAAQISPRDRNGPYVVTQEGYDPADYTLSPDEFVLGRSGKWLSLGLFFKMPIAERRAEFVFGTSAEVMQTMQDLPSKAVIFKPQKVNTEAAAAPEPDDMVKAFKNERQNQA